METGNARDPLARERARQRRQRQVQRRRVALGACILGLILLVVILVVVLGGNGGTEGTTTTGDNTGTTDTSTSTTLGTSAFSAELTGAQSVPPVDTQASASLSLTYDAEADTASYVLEIINPLTNPSIASIYEGAPGSIGAVVATLFAGPTEEGLYSGKLAEDTIDAGDLTGSLAGKTVADLIALIEAGNAYVSIGNTSHPVDAIRGQIE